MNRHARTGAAPARHPAASDVRTTLVVVFLALTASGLSAQEDAQTFRACYVPRVGAIYLLGLPGLPTGCLSSEHQEIAWTEGTPVAPGSVGTDLLADGSVTAPKLADGAVGPAALADAGVTAEKLADGSVGGTALATGAVTSASIAEASVVSEALADGAVTTPKLADGAATEAKLADASVTAEKLAGGAVGPAALAADAVTSAAIADGSVTAADLAPDALGGAVGLELPFAATVEANDASAFVVTSTGTRGTAEFRLDNPDNFNSAITASTNGTGRTLFARSFGAGGSALFRNESFSNEQPAVEAFTAGSGPALLVNHGGFEGDVAVFLSSGQNVARIDKEGVGYFDGGVQSSGADVAELFAVEGPVEAYGPGDVLAISTGSDRTLTRSAGPYSRLVAGVHATKPGLVLTERGIEEETEDLVHLGVVGVIPTKVTAENGPIARGDLLVSASTAGHAMRGTDPALLPGAVIGKALEGFEGPGTGLIRVLVNVR